MVIALKGISSKATQHVLADLANRFEADSGHRLQLESVGGIDAARRVLAGEAFDLVFLASDAIDRLLASGHLHGGTRVDLMNSQVAVAVRAGAARPDISTSAALRAAVLAAPSISLSTGPSGTYLQQLFERWGLADTLLPRLVQAPPGVPVGSLVADGQVALGFQQQSELMHLPGITVLGSLPPDVAHITTFCAALGSTLNLASPAASAARALLAFMASGAADEAKRRHGMAPA